MTHIFDADQIICNISNTDYILITNLIHWLIFIVNIYMMHGQKKHKLQFWVFCHSCKSHKRYCFMSCIQKNYIPQLYNYLAQTVAEAKLSGTLIEKQRYWKCLNYLTIAEPVTCSAALLCMHQKVHVAKMKITKLVKLLHLTTGAQPRGHAV